MKAAAVCTWGDGPDILMTLEGIKGPDRFYDLTVKDAEDLIKDLSMAIVMAKELDQVCIQHDEAIKE
jgi:hypothetical protein